LRGVEGAFWFVLALAVGLGGNGVLAALPNLSGMFSPQGVIAAKASGEGGAPHIRMALFGLTAGDYPPAVLYPVATRDIPDWLTAPQSASAAQPPAIAIVIDDMGPAPGPSRRAIRLPREVALSFLPYADETPALARTAEAAGHDVMVHLPMQAEANDDPGPMALMVNQTPDEMRRRLEWNLSRVPGYIGINNHMGSRFTQDRAALVPVVEALLDRHVFFYDSLTTPRSQAMPVARAFGVASATRDVFLDDAQTTQEVDTQLAELQRIARTQGVALAIGHPHDVTLTALEKWVAGLKGYRLIRIKDAIRMKTEREMSVAAKVSSNSPSP
jgi:uncharacterized protein